jgi:hypothetical protein
MFWGFLFKKKNYNPSKYLLIYLRDDGEKNQIQDKTKKLKKKK